MILDVFGISKYETEKQELFECLLKNKIKLETINSIRKFCANAEASKREFIFSWLLTESSYSMDDYFTLMIEATFIQIKSPTMVYKFETCLNISKANNDEIKKRLSQGKINDVRYTINELIDAVKVENINKSKYTEGVPVFKAGTLIKR